MCMLNRKASPFIAYPLTGIALLIVTLSAVGLAQPGRRLDSPPNRSVVTITRVKPDMLNQWHDLQKNAVVPALKKRGVKTRAVYTSGPFGSAFEYTIVQSLTK